MGERAHRDYKPEGQRGGGASNGVRRGTQNGAAAEPVETVEMESDEEVEPSSE